MTPEKEHKVRLIQCLKWLGYTEFEVKGAILFFNSHHDLKIEQYADDFAAAMLVRIIERQWPAK